MKRFVTVIDIKFQLLSYQVRQICDEFDKSSSGGQKIKQAIKVQRQNSSLSSSLENASKKSKYLEFI